MRKALALALALAGIALVAGSLAGFGMRGPAHPGLMVPAWTEAKWPFPMDQWGIGRAFVCMPDDCGGKIELYVRPKIGFCNCSTGVSDAAELERIDDTELVTPRIRPLGPPRPIKVGWMEGLSRVYRPTDAGPGERMLSIAFNDECDVVVAMATLHDGDLPAAEPEVMEFLNSKPMVLWAKKELGLEFVRREW